MKHSLRPRLLAGITTIVIGTFSLHPSANGMVASVYANGTVTETHNTDYRTAKHDISEIWNRTVTINGGTGTYLGQAQDGTHWVLTANHVSCETISIDNTTLTLTGKTQRLKNADGTNADLKLVAITDDSAKRAFSSDLIENSLPIADSSTVIAPQTDELYTIGTGRSSSIGESLEYGARQKEWTSFTRDQALDNGEIVDRLTIFGTSCYLELFQNSTTSFQGCTYDSGSGVFTRSDSDDWLLAGVLLAVGGNQSENSTSSVTTIGYAENATADNLLVYMTFFADLSQYSEQINAIMSIPEPSTFVGLSALFALALAASVRRRKHSEN